MATGVVGLWSACESLGKDDASVLGVRLRDTVLQDVVEVGRCTNVALIHDAMLS